MVIKPETLKAIEETTSLFTGEGRLRLLTLNELTLLAIVKELGDAANVGSITYVLVVTQGKAASAAQIINPMKQLKKQGVITIERKQSGNSKRKVDTFSLTEDGEKVLKLGIEMAELMQELGEEEEEENGAEQPKEETPPPTQEFLPPGYEEKEEEDEEEEQPEEPEEVPAAPPAPRPARGRRKKA